MVFSGTLFVTWQRESEWNMHRRHLLMALLQLRAGVGRSKFMKCQKFFWLSDDQTYNQPSLYAAQEITPDETDILPDSKISP